MVLRANNGISEFRGRLCVQTMAFPTFPEGFACKQWHFRVPEKALRANNGISDFPETVLHANNGIFAFSEKFRTAIKPY